MTPGLPDSKPWSHWADSSPGRRIKDSHTPLQHEAQFPLGNDNSEGNIEEHNI